MSEKITVKARIDGGNHAIYGKIEKGKEYTINPDHFADELFERPKDFKSRLEIQDEDRRAAKQAELKPVSETPADTVTVAPGKAGKKSTTDVTPEP
jgi:hypothetical protein